MSFLKRLFGGGSGVSPEVKKLQKTVDQMEDMSTNVSNLMSETAEAAANTIKTAIRIEGLGL